MPKVDYKDLEEVTKFLDKISKVECYFKGTNELVKFQGTSKALSQKIKDKYTEIKPDYDRTN